VKTGAPNPLKIVIASYLSSAAQLPLVILDEVKPCPALTRLVLGISILYSQLSNLYSLRPKACPKNLNSIINNHFTNLFPLTPFTENRKKLSNLTAVLTANECL